MGKNTSCFSQKQDQERKQVLADFYFFPPEKKHLAFDTSNQKEKSKRTKNEQREKPKYFLSLCSIKRT